MQKIALLCLALVALPSWAEQGVFRLDVEQPVETLYPAIYESLERSKFFVVFEPNIGQTLARFQERWGADYNRNGLSAIRSMVFCNAWYTNQVGNRDPRMLALCPLHLTLIEKEGRSSVLFARPSRMAAGSAAEDLLKEVEDEVIEAIRRGVSEAEG